MNHPFWHVHAAGLTLGRPGSDQGIVLLDEDCSLGARITLERGGDTAPFAITAGVSGHFTQIAYADSETDGRRKYLEMRHLLEQIVGVDSADVSASNAPELAHTAC